MEYVQAAKFSVLVTLCVADYIYLHIFFYMETNTGTTFFLSVSVRYTTLQGILCSKWT